jgi:hypothetical protein
MQPAIHFVCKLLIPGKSAKLREKIAGVLPEMWAKRTASGSAQGVRSTARGKRLR